MKRLAAVLRRIHLADILTGALIIGLLSVLAITPLQHAKRLSEQTCLMNTLRQLYTAKEIYFHETGKHAVTLAELVETGHASRSLEAQVKYPPGSWSFVSPKILGPGAVVVRQPDGSQQMQYPVH